MAYLTLQTLAFDGGMLRDRGRGIYRSSSTDTPRHLDLSSAVLLFIHNPQNIRLLQAEHRAAQSGRSVHMD